MRSTSSIVAGRAYAAGVRADAKWQLADLAATVPRSVAARSERPKDPTTLCSRERPLTHAKFVRWHAEPESYRADVSREISIAAERLKKPCIAGVRA
jgi:hypothetical protein